MTEAVVLENIDKKFMLKHPYPHEFWALKGINLKIPKGKVIGIIGRNGAGKTTLLNIMAGISYPTSGRLQVCGKVSTLLTLGAGFEEELSGKENIYLNASILGMPKVEINNKFSSVVDFSELNGFIHQPLKTYSQGMKLRLGFSIAIHIEFDILLIDEIISVGDLSFQKKCYARMLEFKKQDKTMVIATQSLDIIERISDEALLLENGRIHTQGEPEFVVARYMELLNQRKFSVAHDY